MIPRILRGHFQTLGACPLCAARDRTLLFELDRLRVHQCRACRFRYMDPHLSSEGMRMLYEDASILAEANPALQGYYEYHAGGKKSRTQQDYERVLRAAARLLPGATEPRLFDVGYGAGDFLIVARKMGWDVDGIDMNEGNCRKLAQGHGLRVRVGKFEDFIPAGDYYHLVTLWDVIEHTAKPGAFVAKAFDMLVPGGVLVLATPNIKGLLNRVSEALYGVTGGRVDFAVKRLYVLEHVGYYWEGTLVKLISDAGFRVHQNLLTETDLDRYAFSAALRCGLSALFVLARVLKQQNRMVMIGQKRAAQ